MKNRRGQSLLELLIAMSIMLGGFVGIMGLINNSLGVDKTVTDDYISTYLAGEGIELVKDAIDNNFVTGNSWRKGLAFVDAATGEEIDINESSTPPDNLKSGRYETDYTVYPSSTTWNCSDPYRPYFRTFSGADFLYFDSSTDAYRYSSPGENLAPTPFTREISIAYIKTTSTDSNPDEMVVHSIVRKNGDKLVDLEDHFYNFLQTSSSICD